MSKPETKPHLRGQDFSSAQHHRQSALHSPPVVATFEGIIWRTAFVKAGVQREYQCVYGAIGPFVGELEWSVWDMMNTGNMRKFLRQVADTHSKDYVLMVLDGASSHTNKQTSNT